MVLCSLLVDFFWQLSGRVEKDTRLTSQSLIKAAFNNLELYLSLGPLFTETLINGGVGRRGSTGRDKRQKRQSFIEKVINDIKGRNLFI